MSCRCAICLEECRQKPGWFAPGEAARAAASVGMPVEKVVNVDYVRSMAMLDGAEPAVFVLLPAFRGKLSGREVGVFEAAPCVFLDGDDCRLHALGTKPTACRELHGETDQRTDLAALWEGNQAEVVELLGREPRAPGVDRASAALVRRRMRAERA